MSEKIRVKIETSENRMAACATMGGWALANCIECPAALSCPILQLKQKSEEMVVASPEGSALVAATGRYDGDGGGVTEGAGASGAFSKMPAIEPKPNNQAREAALKKQAQTEKALRARLNQTSNVPQSKPRHGLKHKTFLELLMDGVTELVLTDSLHQK